MSCQFCHKELVNMNAYEDGLYAILGAWLKENTCIPWYRYHPEFVRPEGMYGMMFISEYTLPIASGKVREVQQPEGEEPKFCYAVEEHEKFMLDLHVFREVGAPIECDQQALDALTPTRSAADVLKQVNTFATVRELRQGLEDADIQMSKADKILTTLNQRGKRWEYWAESSHRVTSCRKTSYPIDGNELAYCVVTCDGRPLCIPNTQDCT